MATDPVNINGTQVYVPVRITYPTGVNYRFGYTSYGQVNIIQKWVPTVTGQGNERVIASTSFNMPGYDPNTAQINCPSFSTRTEWAENWQGGATQNYQYAYGGPSGHEISDPSSRRFRVQTSGLIQSLSIIPSGGDNWTKKDEVTYISDSGVPYNSNLRVSETKGTAITGSTTQIKRSTFNYIQRDGMWLVEHKDEYGDFGISLYRRTFASYTSYPSQYILGLPERISVHDGSFTSVPSVGRRAF